MFGDRNFRPVRSENFVRAVSRATTLTAKVRPTGHGVRIKFSDGRMTWLDRDTHVSESAFLASVTEWLRRHGVSSIEIEFE